jgi:hypothetical protein
MDLVRHTYNMILGSLYWCIWGRLSVNQCWVSIRLDYQSKNLKSKHQHSLSLSAARFIIIICINNNINIIGVKIGEREKKYIVYHSIINLIMLAWHQIHNTGIFFIIYSIKYIGCMVFIYTSILCVYICNKLK